MASSKQLPYEGAQRSPENAEIEARKLLQKFGCDDIYIRISSWSLVLDWLKSNLTLVELNLMTFEEAFMSHILLRDGTTVIEALQNRLPMLTDGEESATPEQIIDAILE